MAAKAVFLDRDDTLIEDPGYLNDPARVKLLPGVELAIRSLHQAGYKLVVVTNQSGIARGMLTEQALELIHAEMRRQLAEKGAHLDAIYFCPFHPEGTVEPYAIESDLRKPQPGMILKAAQELELDLSASWMVGDGPRDIEAGQRAGCRTIRVRGRAIPPMPGEEASDEGVQADFTVRNLLDAARVILREQSASRTRPVAPVAARGENLGTTLPADGPAPSGPADQVNQKVLMEILAYVRQLARGQMHEEFSFTKLLAGIAQAAAVGTLLSVVVFLLRDRAHSALIATGVAGVFQMMALTLFVMNRSR